MVVSTKGGRVLPWTYEEVAVALDTTKTAGEAAQDLTNPKRSAIAVQYVRNNFKQFQRGRTGYITKTMRGHFERFWQDKEATEPAEKVEEPVQPTVEATAPIHTPEPTSVEVDKCELEFEMLQKKAEEQLGDLQNTVLQMGTLKTVHETHEQIKLIKTLTEKNDRLVEANRKLVRENEGLTEFKNKALESNRRKPGFGEKLSNAFSFSNQNNRE